MKIGIIIGSVRDDRAGQAVASWVQTHAQGREHDYEVVDLKTFDVPVLTSPTIPMMADKSYDDAAVQRWSDAIDAFDAYVVVTPEYNHGVPGGLKNAVDSLGAEWSDKAFGMVGYGADGAIRAVEQWRTVFANFSSTVVRAQVALRIFEEFADGGLAPLDRRTDELAGVLDQVEEMAVKLRG